MSFRLVMQARDGRERSFAIKPCTVIGRETTCDVRVPIPTVGAKHCQLTFDGSELRLQDLRSDGGTYHNGQRVDEAVLAADDELIIGPVKFVVRTVNAGESSANGEAPEIVIERQPIHRPLTRHEIIRGENPFEDDVDNLSAG